jgi:hypothetical protein
MFPDGTTPSPPSVVCFDRTAFTDEARLAQRVDGARFRVEQMMKALPAYPALYQINTRVWLTNCRSVGRRATLDDIADVELDRRLNFDWVWLLSVWQTGIAAQGVSRSHAEWRGVSGDTAGPARRRRWIRSPSCYTVHRDLGDFGAGAIAPASPCAWLRLLLVRSEPRGPVTLGSGGTRTSRPRQRAIWQNTLRIIVACRPLRFLGARVRTRLVLLEMARQQLSRLRQPGAAGGVIAEFRIAGQWKAAALRHGQL